MVEILTLSRLGGGYSDAVFDNYETNPEVTLKVTKWKWMFKDVELAIDIPETDMDDTPRTVAGGFKRVTILIDMEGYIDADPGTDSVQEKIMKLWNIAEYGDPANTFAVYRGGDLFGIAESADDGELKIVKLDIEENATVSEPATNISGSTSEPRRAKVSMQLRKMKRNTS